MPDVTEADGLLHPHDSRSFSVLFGGQEVGPVELKQRGLAAMINATAALTTARMVLGAEFRPETALAALRAVTPPFGRGEVIDADGQPLELVLVKNPAGFTVALGTYGAEPVTTMIAINDDYADGQDVSWLYDVSFESLRGKELPSRRACAATTWPCGCSTTTSRSPRWSSTSRRPSTGCCGSTPTSRGGSSAPTPR